MKSKHITLFLLVVNTLSTVAQTVTISEARNKSVGTSVTIQGIVLNGPELGTIRYVQDNTAGIAVYDSKLAGLDRGDEVSITGSLSDYNDLLEIASVTAYNVISSGNALPDPKELSMDVGFDEAYEGQLVSFKDIEFTETGTFKGNWNYDITDGSLTNEVRIDKNTNIVSTQIPEKAITIVGIMGQYQTSYQLLPRDLADLNFLNSVITPVDIQTNSLTLYFETNEKGSTMFKYGKTTQLELGSVSDASLVTEHTLGITGLEPATFYYVQALSGNGSDTVKSGIAYFSTASLSSGDIKVYFNRAVDNSYATGTQAIYLNKKMDDTIAAYIDRAKESIDLAIYNLNNSGLSVNISTALNNAASRGVTVRVIGDGSTANLGFDDFSSSIKTLISPQSSSYKLMHNKFMIIDVGASDPDQPIVWTGSTNLTDEQIHYDANNMLFIQDQALARAYLIEFNEMWGSEGQNPNTSKSKFGQFKTDNTPHYFSINGKLVESYFSPSDNVTQQIIKTVKSADASIYFATMVFTRTEIAYPIKDRYDSGVYVAGIFGDISGSNADAYDVLHTAIGDDIKAYSGSYIFHHKYAIVDYANTYLDLDPLVLTGSHNWSSSANTSNDENTLIIHDADIASIYFQEWAQRFTDEGGTVFVGIEEFEPATETVENKAHLIIIGNELRVQMDAAVETDALIQLYALSGQKVFESHMDIQKGFQSRTFILPELSESVYIYSLIGNKIKDSGKLLLMK